jgi:uncharacterized protein
MPSLKETLDKIRIDDTPKGKGVFADDDLVKGTIITKVIGEHLSIDDVAMLNGNESFCVQISMKDYVMPNPPFYLVNHSCNPNCGLNEKLELITIREIKKDEELTWDYSTSMLERQWTMKCECGASSCRGSVTDFDLLPQNVQQRYIELEIVQPFIVEFLHNR